MSLVERNGLTFHTQALGEPGAGSGPRVVMLHGLLVGSMTTWYFAAAPRLAREHRVLMYDQRGHGKSGRAASGYDLDTMAADLAALLDDEERVTLVGHSYGALVALRFALRRPGRVAKLALVEAPVPPSSVGEIDAFAAGTPEEMVGALPGPLAAALARGGRAGGRLLEQLRFLASESTVLADLARERAEPEEALRALDLPVLCLYGEGSRCRPAGEKLAALLPRAELVLLPGGHFLPVENPRAVAEEIARFCRG